MGESQRRAEAQSVQDAAAAEVLGRSVSSEKPWPETRKIALVKLRDAVLVAGNESRSLIAGERGAARDATQPSGQCLIRRVLGGVEVETLDGTTGMYIPDSNIVMVKYAPRAPSAA